MTSVDGNIFGFIIKNLRFLGYHWISYGKPKSLRIILDL